MKVDILLRTRDYDRDYRWIFKPEYVDRVTEDKMSFLIQMMQKSELKQYLENESLYNLYYLYDENGSALVRSGFSYRNGMITLIRRALPSTAAMIRFKSW